MPIQKNSPSDPESDKIDYLKLLGWVDSGPLTERLKKLGSFWLEDCDPPDEINNIAFHESGHALTAYLNLELTAIEIPEKISGIRLLLKDTFPAIYGGREALVSITKVGSYKNFTADELGRNHLAGLAMTDAFATNKKEAALFESHFELASTDRYAPSLWEDVGVPYAAVLWEWTELFKKEPTVEEIKSVLKMWIEKLKIIFTKPCYAGLINAIQKGIFRERSIKNAGEWMERTLATAGIDNIVIEQLRDELNAVSLESLILAIKSK